MLKASGVVNVADAYNFSPVGGCLRYSFMLLLFGTAVCDHAVIWHSAFKSVRFATLDCPEEQEYKIVY